jgi:hypothetical protein
MKNMPNGPARQAVIDNMARIVRWDAPWIWGLHPKGFTLYHQWYGNATANLMAHNTQQYKRINAKLRNKLRKEWNNPNVWPVVVFVAILVGGFIPGIITYKKREQMRAVSKVN